MRIETRNCFGTLYFRVSVLGKLVNLRYSRPLISRFCSPREINGTRISRVLQYIIGHERSYEGYKISPCEPYAVDGLRKM